MKIISYSFSIKLDDEDRASKALTRVEDIISRMDDTYVGLFDLEFIEYDVPARTINVGLVEEVK